MVDAREFQTGKKIGISVVMQDLASHPQCPHGPALLFSQKGKRRREYYACAAYRDRKECAFFHLAEQPFLEKHKEYWLLEKKRVLPNLQRLELQKRYKEIIAVHPLERGYCHTCSVLVLPKEMKEHGRHEIHVPLSAYHLGHPSELFIPMEGSKREAQFLFSKKATKVLVNNFQQLNLHHVLCIGTPRIHECIQSEYVPTMSSLLLDIDWRYNSFYTSRQFCWYNMFNHHFFLGDQSKKVFLEFLLEGKQNVVVVVDPPFGGRVEVLAFSLSTIISEWRHLNDLSTEDILATFWIFPYFMEPQFKSHLNEFSMLDYKVNYDNHPAYQLGLKGRKHGSPVRIFTNLPPKSIVLPEDEGYKYCRKCEKWVSSENEHCLKCDSCTSKDGRTYIHCDLCNKCVKPSWIHCQKCNRCSLPEHPCDKLCSYNENNTGDMKRNSTQKHKQMTSHKNKQSKKLKR